MVIGMVEERFDSETVINIVLQIIFCEINI